MKTKFPFIEKAIAKFQKTKQLQGMTQTDFFLNITVMMMNYINSSPKNTHTKTREVNSLNDSGFFPAKFIQRSIKRKTYINIY